MSKTVSVIIPAYNAEQHLARAVNSVLSQTCAPLEIIVIDDGSSDETEKVAATFGSAIRFVRKTNGGPASARNLGAKMASGEWLALLDADDWWYPDKLEAQLALYTSPDVALIRCLADSDQPQGPVELRFHDLWERNWITNSSVLVRRSVFQQLGGFDEGRELISVEDYNLWIRIAASGHRIVTCPQVLTHYTRGIGISSNSDRFLRASLYNVEALGAKLELARKVVSAKQSHIYRDFGRKAFFERRLDVARGLFLKSLGRRFSVGAVLLLLATFAPEHLLNFRRAVISRVRSGHTTLDNPSADQSLASPTPPPTTDGPSSGRITASIIDPSFRRPIDSGQFDAPLLITTVDAEEEFDWNAPFARRATRVTSMRSQHLAHRIFERYGVVPVYMVDYPVASQEGGSAPLRELLQDRHCEIGAQLHPWVTPPFLEDLSVRNSYAGNLPFSVEYAKVRQLTDEVAAAFGVTPRIYRAGRYGAGPNTAEILKRLGYQADSSVMPFWSFRRQHGPDFRALGASPFWIDQDRSLLELPVSAAVVGRAAKLDRRLASLVFSGTGEWSRLSSVAARLGLIERIKLTPEGIRINEAKRLVRDMVEHEQRVFVLTYHSPSLEPGNTPYVRTREDLSRFLAWLDEFFDFFQTEIKGRFVSWQDVRTQAIERVPVAA
ncbi:MAG: glycosyltransferase [Acetobacteraceae bacterium]|nr:glycosyltransferase [Acetobacteraceae bacterium]